MRTLEVVAAVFDADVRLEVPLHGAADVAELAFERLLPRVHAHVPFQVGADFELGTTEPALEGGVPRVRAQVHGELAGVAAGVKGRSSEWMRRCLLRLLLSAAA